MNPEKLLFTALLMTSLFLSAQENIKAKYAQRVEFITAAEKDSLKIELTTFLKTLPNWKNQIDLENSIYFSEVDIQLYGYREYPILQIDFRYVFQSTRKKGFLYKAQYIYVSQPSLNKVSVQIELGTTEYIKRIKSN